MYGVVMDIYKVFIVLWENMRIFIFRIGFRYERIGYF